MDPLIAFCHAFSVVAVWPNGNGERRVATAATLDAACKHWERSGARVIVGYLGDCIHHDAPMPDGGYAWGTLQASFGAERSGPKLVTDDVTEVVPTPEPAPTFHTALASEGQDDRTDDPAMVAYQAEVAAQEAADAKAVEAAAANAEAEASPEGEVSTQ